MQIILITGSPGSGKTTVSNALSDVFRQQQIHHVVIDPDEIARVYPENTHAQLKRDALAKLYPLYTELSVEKIIIPITIDNDSDLAHLQTLFGSANIEVINLHADEAILIRRIMEREPNDYWKNKLCGLVKAYVKNESARSYSRIDIDANSKSVNEVVKEICSIVL